MVHETLPESEQENPGLRQSKKSGVKGMQISETTGSASQFFSPVADSDYLSLHLLANSRQ
jgi:hypothetical protein